MQCTMFYKHKLEEVPIPQNSPTMIGARNNFLHVFQSFQCVVETVCLCGGFGGWMIHICIDTHLHECFLCVYNLWIYKVKKKKIHCSSFDVTCQKVLWPTSHTWFSSEAVIPHKKYTRQIFYFFSNFSERKMRNNIFIIKLNRVGINY